jgi:hypothetical protein
MSWIRSLAHSIGRQTIGDQATKAVERWVEHRDYRYQGSMQKLRNRWKNLHAGERCFILGNGPSLNRTDLSLLKDEFTFGTNRIYMLEKSRDFRPTYYVVANELVAEQCRNEIAALPMPKFAGWHCRDFFNYRNDDVTYLWTRCGLRSWFYGDLTEGCWEGSTVTMVCLQLAFYMGFREVVLIGVDHHYVFQGDPHAAQVAAGPDPNHFDPNYFSNGFKWHLPDLEGSEMSYQVANFMFKKSGRRIVDATIGGKLTVFPKVEYASLFERKSPSRAAA